MKHKYQDIRFKPKTRELIEFLDLLIALYQKQGFTLSVRQLYYQCVARNVIPNTEQSYKRIASILNDARMAGLIDWDAIEDRGRDIVQRSRWTSGAHLADVCAQTFYMDMWDNQPSRTFVIVEKAALAGVLEGVCRKNDVPLAARGYPSVSVVRELAMQYLLPATQNGQTVRVLHMGDHDPSGIDMTRDLQERLYVFMGDDAGMLTLDRIALNMKQIRHYQPPPNPAKQTDSRFLDYAEKFGDESWELDALEPSVLVNLVENEIAAVRDEDRWDERETEIARVRQEFRQVERDFYQRGV